MKRDAYYSTCEHMYVVEQRTIDSITQEIPVSEKTVRLWKQAGNWDAKRKELLEQQTCLTSELYVLARKLTKFISMEIDNPDAEFRAKADCLTRLLKTLPVTHKFEAQANAEEMAEKEAERKANQNGLSEEALQKIEQQAKLL